MRKRERPGISGPALLTYGPGSTDLQRKRDLDAQYVQQRSMRHDLALLRQTCVAVAQQIKRSA